MTAVGELHIVRLEGTPRDRGRIHGEASRSLIAEGMDRWKDGIHRSTGMDPDAYLDRFVESTDFMPAIERWTPDLLEEVRGIAGGAAISFRDAYAYQLMDEEWLFRIELMDEQAGTPLEHCSSLGVFGERDAPAILAQNMDLPKVYDGTQTLLHVKHRDSEMEAFVFTPAGLIATCGLNSRGIGLCVNTLNQLGHSRRGLPVAFIARRVIETDSLDDAIRFVRDVPHASGQNYMIGGPDNIVDLECSAHRVVQFMPGATRVYHTNHPLANDDRQPSRVGATDAARASGPAAGGDVALALSNSERRFAFVSGELDDTSRPLSTDQAKSILGSCDVPISVPRHGKGDSMTLGSLVMELSVPPVLHLSPGPPAETAYRTWTFSAASCP